jgi:hypothetical protein
MNAGHGSYLRGNPTKIWYAFILSHSQVLSCFHLPTSNSPIRLQWESQHFLNSLLSLSFSDFNCFFQHFPQCKRPCLRAKPNRGQITMWYTLIILKFFNQKMGKLSVSTNFGLERRREHNFFLPMNTHTGSSRETGDFEVTFLPKRGAGEGELPIQSPWKSRVEHSVHLQQTLL